jgi:hypothetical protein
MAVEAMAGAEWAGVVTGGVAGRGYLLAPEGAATEAGARGGEDSAGRQGEVGLGEAMSGSPPAQAVAADSAPVESEVE